MNKFKKYISRAFDVNSLDQAKNVVLSYEENIPDKFENETNLLVDYLDGFLKKDINILDFGCGMGRVSKEILKRCECNVIGTDISPSMRSFAKDYVGNDKFQVYKNYDLENSIDICLCIFVLQHVENLEKEIENIHNVLKYNGYLILLNEFKRYVPVDVDEQNYIVWMNDELDVFEKVSEKFKRIDSKPYNKSIDINFFKKV